MSVAIQGIVPFSIAEELKISVDDLLISINGTEPEDIIDYNFLCADEEIELKIKKAGGKTIIYEIEKDEDEDLGLVFAANVFDGIRTCNNHCIFCFMAQLPPDARASLKIKDDDYRMSFLEGNYITGTNLSEADIQRIIRLRLSPLYFSVHASEHNLRNKLLGNKHAADIIPLLKRLLDEGIKLHLQLVLCPQINDGEHLRRTVEDLADLGEGVLSVALVPVGLTKYQKNKYLRPFTKNEAESVLDFCHSQQDKYLAERGSRLLFAADEFYLLAKRPFPADEEYEGYWQLENGVGMCRSFLDDWQTVKKALPAALEQPQNIVILTGAAALPIFKQVADDLSKVGNLQVKAVAVSNLTFGDTVTVAGLLTGKCLKQAILKEGFADNCRMIVSSGVLKFGEDILLDGVTAEELQQKCGYRLEFIEPGALALLEAII